MERVTRESLRSKRKKVTLLFNQLLGKNIETTGAAPVRVDDVVVEEETRSPMKERPPRGRESIKPIGKNDKDKGCCCTIF